MFASRTRIDVLSGKVPRKTSAPSVPAKLCIEIDRLGLPSSLSIRRTTPPSSDTFFIVTVRFAAAGLAWTIAATLRLIMMLPCATTFTNATLVHDVLIVSFAARVELITTHGMMAVACCTARSIISIIATSVFMCLFNLRLSTDDV